MEIKLEVNRQNVIDGLIILQLVLLLVLGGYTISLSGKVTKMIAGGIQAGEPNEAPDVNGPTTPPPSEEPVAEPNFKITSADHVYGDLKAKVTLVEFTDVQCPFCQRNHTTIKQVMEKYAGKVRWIVKSFPLEQMHPYAKMGALAAECAGEQGKYYEYLDKLFENQATLGKDMMINQAKLLKLNESKFKSCLDSEKYKTKVENDIAEGNASGVSGTPANFINDKFLGGAYPYEEFVKIIDAELAK